MQSIFRLPWNSEQHLKLSEKAMLDKIRPSPVVDIPLLNKLKRKLPDCSDLLPDPLSSPAKKQRADSDYPEQLLTPCSPRVDLCLPSTVELSRSASPAAAVAASPDRSYALAQSQHDDATTPSPDTARSHRESDGYFTSKPVPGASAAERSPCNNVDPLSGLTPLQQAIEHTFSVQILMKHDELRLIEQELAKCQVALEQLRRCELRPYPGADRPDLAVSEGSGAAVEPPPGHTRPMHAAPYGVVDGPYSRHYAQWLLHDPAFDSLSPRAVAEQQAHAFVRSTRNHGHHVRKSASSSKCLTMTTRNSDVLQSIPNYPPAAPAKEKLAFQTLRRSTDNRIVKLVCKDCKRSNFSSIQGFLNHCRIAHKVDYKSHDLAAIDCGQVLDETELASLPADAQAAPAPKPTPARSASVVLPPNGNRNLIHPLNTPTGMLTPSRTAPPTPASAVPGLLDVPTPPTSANPTFKPTQHAPRLSAYFAKHNVPIDLEHLAAMATQRIDLGVDDDVQSPDTPDAASPLVPFAGTRAVAGGMRPGNADAETDTFSRPSSRKGHRQPTQRPRPSPLAPLPSPSHDDSNRHASAFSSPANVISAAPSPHTGDSNPGLVSDHEDDHGSASEDETVGSTLAVPAARLPHMPSSCDDQAENMDIHSDTDLDGQHGLLIRRNSTSTADGTQAPRAIRSGGCANAKS